MTESALLRSVLLACSTGPTRLFRVNTGMGWVGRLVSHVGTTVVLADARPLHAGMVKGGSDLIGWKTINDAAVFVALECKIKARVTPEQRNFIDAVNRSGGRAGVVRSVDEARAVLL